MAEEALVRGTVRTRPQPFMRQRHGNVALAGARGGLGEGPIHDIALRMATADPPEFDPHRQECRDRLIVCVAVEFRQPLDQ